MTARSPNQRRLSPELAIVSQRNPGNALDVNGAGRLTVLDVLVVINLPGQVTPTSELAGFKPFQSSNRFYNVNGDERCSA
ncbi:MAG: hypothetical protein WBD31_06600, partial [Rubripirellula sp.]